MKTKDNFGATKEDIERGYCDGEAESKDDESGITVFGGAKEVPKDFDFDGGFLGRGNWWER